MSGFSTRSFAVRGLLGVLAVASVASAPPADAAVLCGVMNRTTGLLRDGATLRVRSVCRSSEIQLDAAAIGIATLAKVAVRTGAPLSATGSLSTPAICEPDEVATGGGAVTSVSGGAEITLRSSRPVPDTPGSTPTGWRISAANLNPGTGQITVTAFAVCAAP